MDTSLPVLVTRLPDRRALVRLVRAALRHEVAQVALAEAPRQVQAHTLDLRVGGTPTLALLAEPVGAPESGHFPLRLRPLHRAQAAQLYAILEAENVPSSQERTGIAEAPPADAAPIMRAMQGTAPPPVVDVGRSSVGSPADPFRQTLPLAHDPRRTVPSATWATTLPIGQRPSGLPPVPQLPVPTLPTPGPQGQPLPHALPPPTHPSPLPPRRPSAPPSAPGRIVGGVSPLPPIALPSAFAGVSDPRRTVPSAGWSPPPSTEAEATDGTISVVADFPHFAALAGFPSPLGASHGAGPAAHEPPIATLADPPSGEATEISEPEPEGAPDTPHMENAPVHYDSSSFGVAPRDGATPDAAPPGVNLRDSFFDDALMNLPPLGAEPPETPTHEDDPSTVPPSDGATRAMMTAAALDAAAPAAAPGTDGDRHAWDDDEEFQTLIRPPLTPSNPPPKVTTAPLPAVPPLPAIAPPLPAAGAPPPPVATLREPGAVATKPSRPPSPAPAADDEATHTVDPRTQKQTGSGRKKKTTRRGKPSETKRPKSRTSPPSEAPDGIAESAVVPTEMPDTDKRDVPVLGRKVGGGKYVIESLIGSGAAGAVYKATHRELRRTVAIKLLHPHYQHDPHFMKSFRGEALAASQLDHPNVMRVLDFGQEADGLVYIVMEFLFGQTLQNLLDEERRLTTDRAVEIMVQVCAALSVAHDHGIVHRDIKPDNIMLVPSRNDEGRTFELVKVCDFGIASLQGPRDFGQPAASLGDPRSEEAELSMGETVIAGTPEYMSPEQARGIEIDARSDVYACGICLYELVTGRPPFLGDNPIDILAKQLEEAPRPPSMLLRGLDPILEEIILRAIQKDPEKRQQSARELRVELKELIAQEGDGPDSADRDDLSIVENVPVLDDPASGFPGFFIALSSAVLRFGRFERGHPEAVQAMKELVRSTKAALRGRSELTFARRDSQKTIGFCVMTGTAEIVDLRRLLGSQIYGSFGQPFIDELVKKGVASVTIREQMPELELQYLVEMLLGPHVGEELRKELGTKPLRHVSILFLSDVIGRDRKLSWKVGLCVSRLARDLRALTSVRGLSLKKMREGREQLIGGIARLLTRGDEVRQFLYNADLIDEAVANLRGFSSFHLAPLVVERLLHEACAEATLRLVGDFDSGEVPRDVVRELLALFAARLVTERSARSDAAVTELYRRSLVTDAEIPRDLTETIRASSLADALVRDPSQFLRALDVIVDPNAYTRELATLEAAMAVLARRGEAGALLSAISVLARHAKGGGKPGPREAAALRSMKSMIDKQRLVPIANVLLGGPSQQREAARQLIVLAGSAGAQALFTARESQTDIASRATFVQALRETGPAGWALISAVLPRIELRDDIELGLVEDLLRAVPDRLDPALGDAVARFLGHPRLRPAALAAIVPLWGDRAKRPLVDALEFAEEPARIVAVSELRRMRAIDDQVYASIERLLTMKGSASEELRAAAAAALADVSPAVRARAVQLLVRGIEGKRGFFASLRGDGATEESGLVTEAMARALMILDRAEGLRAVKARIARADTSLRVRLTAVLQMA